MRKTIKGVQILAFITLFCTIVLWIALWVSSAVPGNQSGAHSNTVTNIVDDATGLSEKIDENIKTYQIKIGVKDLKDGYYTSDSVETYVKFKPNETKDREVIYKSSDKEIATVDKNGVVTFKKAGTVKISARLKSDKTIRSKITLRCYGEDPFDPEHPERIKFDFINDSGTISDPVVGERRQILFNDGKTDISLINISSENEDVLYYWRGYLYGRREGEANLTIKLNDADGERTITERVKVGAGSISPVNLIAKNDITLYHGNEENKYSLLDYPEGEEGKYDCLVKSSDSGVVALESTETLNMNGIGKAVLTYTSCYDPTNKIDINVDVLLNPPKKMTITGPDTLVAHDTEIYTVKVSPMNYSSKTTWSVVKGNGKIDAYGRLTATGYGKIVIRCTSNIDESVYVEKEIQVKLFVSAHGFVRKVMGHAGLSAVLGLGIFMTLLLLLKSKYLIVTSIPLAYIYSFVSELIQKFTPGRYASYNDVFVDFFGALIGMCIAFLIYAIISLLWRIINKKSYLKFREACRVVNYKTLFYKTSKLESMIEELHIVEPEDDIMENGLTTDILSENDMGNKEPEPKVEFVSDVSDKTEDTPNNEEPNGESDTGDQ